VLLKLNQEGQKKMQANQIDYKHLQRMCDKTAKDLELLQNTLLEIKFPEIFSAISLLEFVSFYICGEQNAA